MRIRYGTLVVTLFLLFFGIPLLAQQHSQDRKRTQKDTRRVSRPSRPPAPAARSRTAARPSRRPAPPPSRRPAVQPRPKTHPQVTPRSQRPEHRTPHFSPRARSRTSSQNRSGVTSPGLTTKTKGEVLENSPHPIVPDFLDPDRGRLGKGRESFFDPKVYDPDRPDGGSPFKTPFPPVSPDGTPGPPKDQPNVTPLPIPPLSNAPDFRLHFGNPWDRRRRSDCDALTGGFDAQGAMWRRNAGLRPCFLSSRSSRELWWDGLQDPNLTDAVPEIVFPREALQSSGEKASRLVADAQNLEELIIRRRSGELSQERFQALFSAGLDEVEMLAADIRSGLGPLVLSDTRKFQLPALVPARSLLEMEGQVDELISMSVQLQQKLRPRVEQPSVVSVAELTGPSFKTLTHRIEDLARILRKSSSRLPTFREP